MARIPPSGRAPQVQPPSKAGKGPSKALLTSKEKVSKTAHVKAAIPVFSKAPPRGTKTQEKLIQKIFKAHAYR